MSATVSVDASASLGSSFAAARIGWVRILCSGFRPVEGE
jgi:hypothetical protein